MKAERFPGRHPMCNCPELTWTNGAEVSRANADCRERSNGLTHRVLTAEELEEIVYGLR